MSDTPAKKYPREETCEFCSKVVKAQNSTTIMFHHAYCKKAPAKIVAAARKRFKMDNRKSKSKEAKKAKPKPAPEPTPEPTPEPEPEAITAPQPATQVVEAEVEPEPSPTTSDDVVGVSPPPDPAPSTDVYPDREELKEFIKDLKGNVAKRSIQPELAPEVGENPTPKKMSSKVLLYIAGAIVLVGGLTAAFLLKSKGQVPAEQVTTPERDPNTPEYLWDKSR